MTIKGEIKEAAGFVKEEAFEHGKTPESKQKAQEGRDLRNEGRVEDGKAPKDHGARHGPLEFDHQPPLRRGFFLFRPRAAVCW